MKEDQCELVILETSDLHGFIYPANYANQQTVSYGLARLATVIQNIRSQQPYTILIDNGDCLQGTPLTYYHARVNSSLDNPVVSSLNHLCYDAAVLGNHEFNYGLPYLKEAIRTSQFPWLSANTVDAATGEPYFGQPYQIREFSNGLKVGILGLTTSYIPNWEQPAHIEGIRFEDPVEAAHRWVPYLKNHEHVDLVVVSYHGGLERDPLTGEATETLTRENVGYALCESVPGIDVLLTGHQHRSIENCIIHGVVVVQPSNEGRFLGKVTLKLTKEDGSWRLTQGSSKLIPAALYEADPDILRIIGEVEALTQSWLDKPMGYVEGDMSIDSHFHVRLQEHPLITFINQVQMDVSGASISNTALFDNKSPGFTNQITMREIVSNYVYPNSLKVIRITGQDIRDALEQSAEYFAIHHDGNVQISEAYLTPKPQHYNYDMWAGIDYILDISKPVGCRVIRLEQNGVPIEAEDEFDVVMNNYRAGGGGNFTMFQGKPVVKDITTDMVELLADYIRERSTIQAKVNGNWLVINGASSNS